MICPRDSNQLHATYKHGIEVDICPSCDGVWLDRGELDKILKLGGGKNISSETGHHESKSSAIADVASVQPLGFSSGGAANTAPTGGSSDSAGIFDFFSDLFS